MGRNSIPSRSKKKPISFSLSKWIIIRIREKAKDSSQSNSDFLEQLLKRILFNDSEYTKYMVREKKLELAYWQFEHSVSKESDNVRKDKLASLFSFEGKKNGKKK